jgi:hypothetical protein
MSAWTWAAILAAAGLAAWGWVASPAVGTPDDDELDEESDW